jgi:hypothetical protein
MQQLHITQLKFYRKPDAIYTADNHVGELGLELLQEEKCAALGLPDEKN